VCVGGRMLWGAGFCVSGSVGFSGVGLGGVWWVAVWGWVRVGGGVGGWVVVVLHSTTVRPWKEKRQYTKPPWAEFLCGLPQTTTVQAQHTN